MKAKDTSGMRILFADQDVVLCVSARRALQRRGYSVTLAHEGTDALDRFGQKPFDVVVVGAALPGRNGLQVLREIKKQSSQTPVILVGDVTPELTRLASREGAFAYLPIPDDEFQELIATIDRASQSLETSPTKTTIEAATKEMPLDLDESRLVALLRELVEASRTLPLARTKELSLQASAAAMDAEHAVILLARMGTGLQLDTALGFSDQAAAARDFVDRVGDAFAWRVATARQTLIDRAQAQGAQATFWFVGTPLIAHDELLGVLVVYPLSSDLIDPPRVAWLETYAAQCALAIRLERLGDENERLSPNDPLTGALKRTVFLDLADHEFRRSWRYKQPISAIIVDVDGMRGINATSGREFGDRVLHQVANVCRGIVRSIDLVGRYDNDSFALLLLMTDRDGAKSAAERLRRGIGSIDLSDEQGPVRVTASLGVSAYPREGCASIFDLLLVTQEAQRAAQRSGVNQVVYA